MVEFVLSFSFLSHLSKTATSCRTWIGASLFTESRHPKGGSGQWPSSMEAHWSVASCENSG